MCHVTHTPAWMGIRDRYNNITARGMCRKDVDIIEFSTFCVSRQREREILSRTARYCENTVHQF